MQKVTKLKKDFNALSNHEKSLFMAFLAKQPKSPIDTFSSRQVYGCLSDHLIALSRPGELRFEAVIMGDLAEVFNKVVVLVNIEAQALPPSKRPDQFLGKYVAIACGRLISTGTELSMKNLVNFIKRQHKPIMREIDEFSY